MTLNSRLLLLAFAGGALGTGLRVGLAEALDLGVDASPSTVQIIGLFIVNVVGAAALGWFNGSCYFDTPERKAFWSTGLAGGFTTLSGVAVWLVLAEDLSGAGIALITLQIALGLDAYWLARRAAKKRGRK
jgi:fluoride ion exporter CrcB/FEX